MLKLDFTPFPRLNSARLTLRSLELKDEKEVFALRSDKSVAKYLDRPLLKTVDGARAYIRRMQKGVARNKWIIGAITLGEGPMIGSICLWNIVSKRSKAEIGYELLPDFQRKGIMQEAASLVISYGFDKMALKRIEAILAEENKASVKLLERNGFVKDPDYHHKKKNLVLYVLERP